MGITKEAVQKAREENILSEQQTAKEETKSEVSKLKPRQVRSTTPSSGPTKSARKPKSSIKLSDDEKKRKTVIFVTMDEEETKSDEVMKEVKAQTPKVTKISKEKPSGRTRSGKKSKAFEFDEALKQGKFTIFPPIALEQTVNKVVKNGNLKSLSEWYDNYDESGKRTLEEVTVEYLNVYSKTLIELMSIIPKSLYDILDAKRQTTSKEDERLNEYVLVNLCSVITIEEIDRLLKLTKNKFRSKHRVKKSCQGRLMKLSRRLKRF